MLKSQILKKIISLKGRNLFNYHDELSKLEGLNHAQRIKIRNDKLKRILLYAHKYSPYYSKILEESNVFCNGEINLEKFNLIPYLTKDLMRAHFHQIKSSKFRNKNLVKDTSGGSTGEPVAFLKDRESIDYTLAEISYMLDKAGKNENIKEIKLWGSERDIILGNRSIKSKIRSWLFNRIFLNSFKMSERMMNNYVEILNNTKEYILYGYVESLFEFAKHIKKNKVKIIAPVSIISTGGSLEKFQKDMIQKSFNCKVLNQYGSREVGMIAAECINQKWVTHI